MTDAEIVRRFKAGDSVSLIVASLSNVQHLKLGYHAPIIVEQIIRDFMNGKFTLKPQRKSRERK